MRSSKALSRYGVSTIPRSLIRSTVLPEECARGHLRQFRVRQSRKGAEHSPVGGVVIVEVAVVFYELRKDVTDPDLECHAPLSRIISLLPLGGRLQCQCQAKSPFSHKPHSQLAIWESTCHLEEDSVAGSLATPKAKLSSSTATIWSGSVLAIFLRSNCYASAPSLR